MIIPHLQVPYIDLKFNSYELSSIEEQLGVPQKSISIYIDSIWILPRRSVFFLDGVDCRNCSATRL